MYNNAYYLQKKNYRENRLKTLRFVEVKRTDGTEVTRTKLKWRKRAIEKRGKKRQSQGRQQFLTQVWNCSILGFVYAGRHCYFLIISESRVSICSFIHKGFEFVVYKSIVRLFWLLNDELHFNVFEMCFSNMFKTIQLTLTTFLLLVNLISSLPS